MVRSGVLALAMAMSIGAAELLRQTARPSDSERGQRAYLALAGGHAPDAIALYTDAINRRPGDFMSYYRRGVTYARMGALAQALADLDQAVRRAPSVKTANELGFRAWNSLLPETHALNLVVLVRAARADVRRAMKRPEGAIEDLSAAIALDPRRTNLWHTRGLVHLEMGNAGAAAADFSALLARRENVDWRFARGLAHYAGGDYALAEADFATAARMDPGNGLFARWLARSRGRRGPFAFRPFSPRVPPASS